MIYGKLSLTEGFLAANVAPGARMDAAVLEDREDRQSDDSGAFEIDVEAANVLVGPAESYRRGITLEVSCDRATMRDLGVLLLLKSGAPAFNERQWRLIADALRTVTGSSEVDAMADQIEGAYR